MCGVAVVIVGDSGTGKTSLRQRFVAGTVDLDHKITVGVDFASKDVIIAGKVVRAHLWDTGTCVVARIRK